MAQPKERSYEELRESIIAEAKNTLQKEIDTELQQFDKPLTPEIISEVTAKFHQTYTNYLRTAFDVVFQNELLSVEDNDDVEILSNGKSNTVAEHVEADQHDLSVTNEQLQEMDNSVTKVARRRKEYPKKCTKFLEKTLEYQLRAAEKIRVNVNSVEPLVEEEVLEESNTKLHESLENLQVTVRKGIQKSVRIEGSLQMLREIDHK